MDISDSSWSGSLLRWQSSEDSSYDQRPVSRRGAREYINQLFTGIPSMSGTRPTSAYRGLGTASRIGTASFGPVPSTASRTASMTGFSVVDRPITQHGLSGLRTGTARGYQARQLQDKRYWEEVLQVKIRELKAEIGRLNEQADNNEREKSANKHYEKRVKEMALELTDLQGRLSDYNTVYRIASGAINKDEIIDQTKELEENNKRAEEALEHIFAERQRKENQLRQLKEQVEKEQAVIKRLLTSMSPAQRSQYDELESNASKLRDDAHKLNQHLNDLQNERETLNREISISQAKIHMAELCRRLKGAEEQRDNLIKEINNKLQPHEEKEQLLRQVREDNAAIASMESNALSIKEQLKKVQELIEQSEQDLQEGQSERYQKYRELKKREEAIENFMSAYDENFNKEVNKIAQLEADIAFALEHSSSNIDLDLNEIDSLKQKEGIHLIASLESEGKKTVDGLTKELETLKTNLKRIEERKQRIENELTTLPEKINVMKEEMVLFSDLEKLRNEGAVQKQALENELQQLKEKLAPTDAAVLEAESKLKNIQTKLHGNPLYGKLNEMEEKITQLENSKAILQDDIASITMKGDYETTKTSVFENISLINKDIIESLNNKGPDY